MNCKEYKAPVTKPLRLGGGQNDGSIEMLPGLHVVNDTKVVLVAPQPPLHLVEEIAQLHEDDQTRHGQPDVAEKLWRVRDKHADE